AVPASMARPISEQLIASGTVRRPYVGVLTQDLTSELRASFGKGAPTRGALVAKVEPAAPAGRSGVKPGDIITSVNGETVDSSAALQRLVLRKKIGQQIALGVWRDGSAQRIALKTAELPREPDEAGGQGGKRQNEREGRELGLALQDLTPELARRLELDGGTSGVVITQVRRSSPAAKAGLRPGDVVLEVDRRPV